nr:hypothetical protein [Tanacetum cinerariifolium]
SPIIHQPPQELSIKEMEDLKKQYLDELKRLSNLESRDEIKIAELKENFNVTLVLSTEEPDNSLSMGDEHLDSISAMESDEFIKSSVENLIPIPTFYDDHVKEISSGSPTTHFDSFLYASFIFDLSINPFPPTDMSDFYEFTDELIPFISPPEYDCFLFKVKPNSWDFTKDVVEDILQ